jgi:hypothetical protein
VSGPLTILDPMNHFKRALLTRGGAGGKSVTRYIRYPHPISKADTNNSRWRMAFKNKTENKGSTHTHRGGALSSVLCQGGHAR